jgi:prepilin-type processing-associated H-X9-DG protein
MRRNSGLTLVELLGVVLIACVLIGMLSAVITQSLEGARRTACIGNLRQWGVALSLYLPDHDGRIPRRGQGVRPVEMLDRPDDWFNCLPPYLGLPPYSELVIAGREPRPHDKSIFVCPSAGESKQAHFLSYGMNMYLSPWNRPDMHRLQEIPSPSQLAFLADGPGGWSSTVPSGQNYSVRARHAGTANVLFVDGHIVSFSGTYLGCGKGNETKPDIRWETETSGINQTSIP